MPGTAGTPRRGPVLAYALAPDPVVGVDGQEPSWMWRLGHVHGLQERVIRRGIDSCVTWHRSSGDHEGSVQFAARHS